MEIYNHFLGPQKSRLKLSNQGSSIRRDDWRDDSEFKSVI